MTPGRRGRLHVMDKSPEIDETESPLDRVQLRFLVGPTGAGKSELGVELARRAAGRGTGLEIVALDSMTVYRGLDVGTAKPAAAERGGVPHHLLDVADPTDRFDLHAYVALVEATLAGMEERGALPLFVGGTGLYLAALVRGLFQGPPIDPVLRERLEAEAADGGLEEQRERLRDVDPEAHARIHPRDVRRTVRALEVYEQTGVPLSEHQHQWSAQRGGSKGTRERRARIAGLELPTDVLDERIRERTSRMLDAGWPEEARALVDAGALGPSAVQALGYATAASLGRGEIERDAALDEIALRTRQFARRQRTWFRKFDVARIDPREPRVVEALEDALDLT